MEVAVRPRLDRARVERLVRDALGPVEFTAHEEFTDGYFNAAHALDTADGRRLVVKIAPDKGLKLQRYEADLMGAEIDCFERAIAAGVPMPRLWHGDADRGLMIMDRLAGVTLLSVRETLSREELHGLRREIGALSARFGDVTGEHFGYRRPSGRTAADTWSAAFAAMAADAAADVADGPWTPGLPLPLDAITAKLNGEKDLLDEVDRPSLVHFDLWDGNVFVVREDGRWRVEAFIDGERAFYGDPLAELVILKFSSGDELAPTVDGFLGRAMTAGEERRLSLYRVYLSLLILGELGVRGYGPEDAAFFADREYRCLEREFAALGY